MNLPPLPEGDRFADTTKFRRLGTGGGRVLYECWYDAIRAYATAAAEAAVLAERAACIAALMALNDRSGVNADGQTWLMRLTRGDCVAAIRARTTP